MNTAIFSAIRFVLVRPSHPGNIGGVARAMKNMGFSRLYLVQPEAFPHPKAKARASGADNVLENAIVTETLTEALANCSLVMGTSARLRALPWPVLSLREASLQIAAESKTHSEIAIVFGPERIGLSNEELAQCHYLLNIPANPQFSSLNLACAVQLVAYELSQALQESAVTLPVEGEEYDELATAEEIERFYQHLATTLIEVGFLDPQSPKRLMPRLRRLFNRARLEKTEVNILRGILTAVNKKSSS